MGRLDGKTALITGAARGTGAAIAAAFTAEGATVVVTDILDDRGRATAEELGATYVRLDVTSEADWRSCVAGLDALHVLVNNAAVLHLTSIDNTTTDIFETVMRVNLLGAFLGTRECLPLLRASGGSIVHIGSSDSVQGTPATVAYTASKFALRGLAKVTALENGKHGIRANVVCPRAGNAEMLSSLVGPELSLPEAGTRLGRFPDIPLGRTKGPADVVGAVLFLASDESRYCTGTEIVVDGGNTAGEYIDVPGQFQRG